MGSRFKIELSSPYANVFQVNSNGKIDRFWCLNCNRTTELNTYETPEIARFGNPGESFICYICKMQFVIDSNGCFVSVIEKTFTPERIDVLRKNAGKMKVIEGGAEVVDSKHTVDKKIYRKPVVKFEKPETVYARMKTDIEIDEPTEDGTTIVRFMRHHSDMLIPIKGSNNLYGDVVYGGIFCINCLKESDLAYAISPSGNGCVKLDVGLSIRCPKCSMSYICNGGFFLYAMAKVDKLGKVVEWLRGGGAKFLFLPKTQQDTSVRYDKLGLDHIKVIHRKTNDSIYAIMSNGSKKHVANNVSTVYSSMIATILAEKLGVKLKEDGKK